MKRAYKWDIQCPECWVRGKPRSFVDWSYFKNHLGGTHFYLITFRPSHYHSIAPAPTPPPETSKYADASPWYGEWVDAFCALNPNLSQSKIREHFSREAGKYGRLFNYPRPAILIRARIEKLRIPGAEKQWRILELLKAGKATWLELHQKLRMPPNTLYFNLTTLLHSRRITREVDTVARHPAGPYYSISDHQRGSGF